MQGNDKSSWWWSGTGRTILIVGGAAIVVCGAVFFASSFIKVRRTPIKGTTPKTIKQNEAQLGSFEKLREGLKSRDPEKRKETLDEIYDCTKFPETHKPFRTTGCLDILLELFGSRSDDEGVVFRLIRVLANLSTNEENRIVIGESKAIEDMIYYLDSRWNSEIREDVLRGLMNLSIAPQNEDLIREKGGLQTLLELFKTETADSKIMFQAVRVLVNLACNAKNRKLMAENHVVERVLELLHGSLDTELLTRLVRLYGTFSLECSAELYELLADQKHALLLITLLKKEIDKKEAKNTSLCEIILYAIARVTGKDEEREGADFERARRSFSGFFVKRQTDLDASEVPVLLIASMLAPEGSFSASAPTTSLSLQMAVISALNHLACANDEVKDMVRGNDTAYARVKSMTKIDNAHIAKAAQELLDSLQTMTKVEELD